MTHDERRMQFRNAMASLAAAVNVITTDGPRGRCGITASAVCSVTDSPPTMLVCINQSSFVHDVLHDHGNIGINVLGARGQEPASVFAGMTGCTMEERFERVPWRPGRLGVPVLDDALVTLEGRIVESKTVGSHSVIFVQIEHIDLRGQAGGLVYFDRRFHNLTCETA